MIKLERHQYDKVMIMLKDVYLIMHVSKTVIE